MKIKLKYEHWEILNKKFHNKNIRLKFLNILLKSRPKMTLGMMNPKEENEMVSKLSGYYLSYRMTIELYMNNRLTMIKEVKETNYYKSLSSDDKSFVIEFHKDRGNEVMGID